MLVTGENNQTLIAPNLALYLSSGRGRGVGGGSRGELAESDGMKTPRPRERFIDTVEELLRKHIAFTE